MGLHTVTGKVSASTGAVVDAGLMRLYPTGEPSLSRTTPLGPDDSFAFDDVADEECTIAAEFSREIEILGLTEDKAGLRERIKKAPYANVSHDIRVASENPPAVVLQVDP